MTLASPTGPFIGDIADVVAIDALGLTELFLVDITVERAFACRLRTRLVSFAPTELRFQK